MLYGPEAANDVKISVDGIPETGAGAAPAVEANLGPEITVPPIIDSKTFEKVQKKIQDNPQNTSNNHKSLLKGIIECGHCGRKLGHRFKGKNNHYYGVCTEREWKNSDGSNYKHINHCELKKSLILEKTDNVVSDNVLKIISNSSLVKSTQLRFNSLFQLCQLILSPDWVDSLNFLKYLTKYI